jgi:protein N-terminal methyltransferase
MYLTDADLHDFLVRSRDNLEDEIQSKRVLMFVKENVNDEKFLIDRTDNSIMRTTKHFEAMFESAGLKILRQFYQQGFPSDLYPISCFVL